MNKNINNPIITLAALSFLLTVSHYGGTKPLTNAPQFSNNTDRVEQPLNTSSQFDALEANQTGSAALGLSAGIAVVGILSFMKTKNSFKASSTASRSCSRPSPLSKEKIIWLNQASRELQNKLLRLLYGDQELAMRLLSQIKMNNPGRSTNWCVEKVIYDLERDRGR